MSFEKSPRIRSLKRRSDFRNPILFLLEVLDDAAVGDERRTPTSAHGDLDASFGYRSFRYDESSRNAQEVGIGELLAGAHIAIIVQGIYAILFEDIVEAIGFGGNVGIAARNRDDMHLVGRHVFRPHQSLVV